LQYEIKKEKNEKKLNQHLTKLQLVTVTVTVTTVTCSSPHTINAPYNQTDGAFQSSHSVPGVNSMKQKTLQFVLE